MAKFAVKEELDSHKHNHPINSEAEDDDFFDEEFVPVTKSDTDNVVIPLNDSSVIKTCDKIKKTRNDSSKKPEIKEEDNKDTEIKVETSFKCDTCNVYFETSDDAKRHTASVKCRFACRLCNRKFNTLYAFVVHVMQHKTNAVKNQQNTKSSYLCQLCDKLFDDCFQLKRHEIKFHKKKLTSSCSIGSALSQNDSTANKIPVEETTVITETEINPFDTTNQVQNTFGNALFTCELCYDIFNESVELDKHMEFHKQLDKISEQIVIDDDDEFVEVVEDKTDKHDIKTTMRAAKRPSSEITQAASTSSSSISGKVAIPRLKKLDPLSNKLKLTLSMQPNKQLSDKIKEMLTPNSEKKSKTIFLSSPLVKNPLKKKTQKVVAPKPPAVAEITQTGPLSYAVSYSNKKQQNVVNTQIPSPSTSSNTNTQYILTNALSTSSATATNPTATVPTLTATQYAYVIIPHNNTSAAVVVPTGNIAVNLPSQNYSNMVEAQPINTSSVNCVPSIQNSSSSMNQNSDNISISNYHPDSSNVTISNASIANVTSTCKSSTSNSSSFKSSTSTTSEISSASRNTVPANFSSNNDSNTTVRPPSASKVVPQTSTDIPEIVIIDSDDEDELSYPTSFCKIDIPKPTLPQNIDEISSQNTTIVARVPPTVTSNVDVPENISDSDSETLQKCSNNPDKNNDSSDSETIGDLIIDEKESDDSRKPNLSTSDDKEYKMDDNLSIHDGDEPKASDEKELHNGEEKTVDSKVNVRGMISVKRLEDLIEPGFNRSDEESADKTNKRKEKKFNFPMKCDGCSVVFHRFRTLRIHDKKKQSCSSCDFRCCRIFDLKNHYLTDHNLFFCCRCKLLFDCRSDLEEHRKIHTCKTCFGIYSDLSAHICKKVKITVIKPNGEDDSEGSSNLTNESVSTPL